MTSANSTDVTIALSAGWADYPARFNWIVENEFALEYAPHPERLDLLPEHIDPYLTLGIPVRYHAFFPGYEIGHPEKETAAHAMRIHVAVLEAISGRSEQVITFHVGLDWRKEVDTTRVIENLSRLVERARSLGITICIENLRRGPASHPENIIEWASASGAMITLDIGHALCCECAATDELTLIGFIDMFRDRLYEVHMYERESDRHYPPKNLEIIGPAINQLMHTECTWWTIELTDYEEALNTRGLLIDHLKKDQEVKP